jgi:glutamine amidotransferase
VIAIVDYRAGNLTSVRLAFEHLGAPAKVTRDPGEIAATERVVFPGVGAAGSAMHNLNELGLSEMLRGIVSAGTPFLGICLGTQVIFEHSEEDGGVECLGIVPGTVKKFSPSDPLCKIPQMGWNTIEIQHRHPLFDGIEDESEFYFVHSYYPVPSDASYVLAETGYAGARFASVIGKDNLVATQFHPERSGRIGLKLLENFSQWDGSC